MGRQPAVDALGGRDWERFASAEALYDVWGPVAGSPWAPYHCVTLFAGLDVAVKEGVGFPVAPPELPHWLTPESERPEWAAPDTWVIVDLPGPLSVALGMHLCATAGFQPVCTFDNWPHSKGLLRSELVLGTLLFGASALERARASLPAGAPPMWLCDRERLAVVSRVPGRFDNRYILEDRLMPSEKVLRGAGVRRIVCVVERSADGPGLDLMPSLYDYRGSGLEVVQVSLSNEATYRVPAPLPHGPPDEEALRKLVVGMVRSSGGGFGGFIPTPSSG